MGLYAVPCSICKKVFQWFSGGNNPAQVCADCMKPKSASAIELVESWKNFNPTVPLSWVVAARKAARNK